MERTVNPTLPKCREYFRKLPELSNSSEVETLRDDVSVGAPRGTRFLDEMCLFRPQFDARAHLTAI